MELRLTIPAEYDTAPIAAISGTKLLLLGGETRQEAIENAVRRGGIESHLGLNQLVHWSAHLIASGVKDNATAEQIENAQTWLKKLGPYKVPKTVTQDGVVTRIEFNDP